MSPRGGPSHNPGGPTNSGVLFNQFVPAPLDDLPVSDYRLAPAVGVRFVGGLLVLVAVLVFAATAAGRRCSTCPTWLLLPSPSSAWPPSSAVGTS